MKGSKPNIDDTYFERSVLPIDLDENLVIESSEPPLMVLETKNEESPTALMKSQRLDNESPEDVVPLQAQTVQTAIVDDRFTAQIYLECDSPRGPLIFEITNDNFKIGKKTTGGVDGVVSFNSAISRIHCLIKYIHDDNCHYVEDLGSLNGTFVNGIKINQGEPEPLRVGDKLMLANLSFDVKQL
jgi:predicted component of type VI protein secretion system